MSRSRRSRSRWAPPPARSASRPAAACGDRVQDRSVLPAAPPNPPRDISGEGGEGGDASPSTTSPATLWTLRDVRIGTTATPRLLIDSLDITAGTTAIVGPSGAGKSTLVDLCCGVLEPDAGQIARPSAAIFFGGADGGLWPGESVRRHLELVVDGDRKHAASQASELLARFELEPLAASRPHELSQGERTRLSVARAIAASPPILLLDEPLAHIDRRRQRAVAEAICDWAEGATPDGNVRTLVVATHEPGLAQRFDRCLVLDDGRVAADGSTESLRRSPPNDAAAWSLGVRSVFQLVATLTLWLAAGLSLASCTDADAAIPIEDAIRYMVPNDGPRLPAPRAVTVDASDRRYVLDNAGRVLVYDRSGDDPNDAVELVQQFPMPDATIGKPEGILVLPDGRIAVADTHYSRVVVFQPDGTVDFMFGTRGDGDGQFLFPVAIAQGPSGDLYVAEYGGGDRVQRFTADGQHKLTFGEVGTGPRQLQRPSGLHVTDDRVYVTDAINNRIQVFSTEGAYVETLAEDAGLHWPYDLAVSPTGDFVVPEYGAGTVAVLSRRGELLARYGGVGRDSGQLYTPWGLAIDSAGTIIVADTGNHRLVEFRP